MTASSISWRAIAALPARGFWTVTGAWALVWDGVSGAVRDPGGALEWVQLRGVRAHRQLLRSWRHAEHDAHSSVQRLADGALTPVRLLHAGVVDSSSFAEQEVEKKVQIMLDRLGIPTRSRIVRLSREIEQLSARIDLELQKMEEGAAN